MLARTKYSSRPCPDEFYRLSLPTSTHISESFTLQNFCKHQRLQTSMCTRLTNERVRQCQEHQTTPFSEISKHMSTDPHSRCQDTGCTSRANVLKVGGSSAPVLPASAHMRPALQSSSAQRWSGVPCLQKAIVFRCQARPQSSNSESSRSRTEPEIITLCVIG